MKKNLRVVIFYVVVIAVIIISTAALWNGNKTEEIIYSDVVNYFKNEQVTSFVVDDENYIELKLKKDDGSTATEVYQLRDLSLFINDVGDLINEQYEAGIITSYDYPAPVTLPWWVSFLPYVIIFIVFIALWWFMMNQATGGKGSKINSFGRAKAKLGSSEKKKVYFTDVAGADEEKAELEEIVEFLRDPVKFTKLGAKIPHGVLLVGPPGTGKTLLAKAVAGEAGVPFFSISGSDFVEMYVGVGASRVRDLFETARKSHASIVFIDEIDAVGRHRGAGLGGGHDEREQTLNQLLVEMDGFGSNDSVIVIAATNRPDILDPALLRPGRFDRQITVSAPDIHGREEILKVHSRNKPFESSVDLAVVAKSTAGFTGADLANLLNEAALLAARRGKSLIGMEDIQDAFTKVIAGPQKKSMRIKESEKRKTAYHEAGHAIVSHVLPLIDPVHQISIIPSGSALGYTLNLPEEDKFSVYKEELKQQISMLLGGRAAEKVIFDDISGGASNDIQRATQIAKKMVMQLGMSDELGPILFGSGHEEVFLGKEFSNNRDYSEEIAAKIDAEVHKLVTDAFAVAQQILRNHMGKLHFVAEYLVEHEMMDGEQFKLIMEGEPTVQELEAMVAEKRRRSEEQNERRAAEIAENERKREEERRRTEGGMSTHSDVYDGDDDTDTDDSNGDDTHTDGDTGTKD